MQFDARIYTTPGGAARPYTAARLNELGSVGSRQIADRDRLTSRLYSAVLAAPVEMTPGQPVWVQWRRFASEAPDTFVAYPVLQKGRLLRLHRRDGEFHPGVVLEQLGAYERNGGLRVTGGDGWYFAEDPPSVYFTDAFETYEDLSELRGRFYSGIAFAGTQMVLGDIDEILASSDGKAWSSISVPGAAEVYDLAWDGVEVWVASEGGAFRIDLGTQAVTQADVNPVQAFSHRFMNFDLFRARFNSGSHDLYARNGTPFRNIDFDLLSLVHNWVVTDEGHYVTGREGQVIRFDETDDQTLGLIPMKGRSDAWEPATFLIRDTVFAVAFGQLAMVTEGELRIVYDFGQEVRAYPSLGGFIIARLDGLLYRVRRINIGPG